MTTDTVTIALLEKGFYTDQYGFEHECMFLTDKVDVVHKGEQIEWEYYGVRMYDWIYEDGSSRKFRRHSATDFGCASSWSEIGTTNHGWITYNNPNSDPRYYLGKYPVIDRGKL